jgi:hypothetical protein
MLFSKGAAAFSGLFATHPPLTERIKRLDPSFKPGDFQTADAGPATGWDDEKVAPLAAEVTVAARELTSEQLISAVGSVGPDQLGFAEQIHRSLPEELLAAAHSRDDSLLLALALALHRNQGTLSGQLEILQQKLGPLRAQRCERFATTLRSLGPQYRLPLLELAFPSLKDRPRTQLEFLLLLIDQLVRHDGELELFEYTLLRVLSGYLIDAEHPSQMHTGRHNRRAAVAAATFVLAAVARHGHPASEQAEAAYRRGLAQLGVASNTVLGSGTLDLAAFDAALNRLGDLNIAGRRAMLRAVYATVAHDGKVTVPEQELLRVVSAALRCPLPPLGPATADVAG